MIKLAQMYKHVSQYEFNTFEFDKGNNKQYI